MALRSPTPQDIAAVLALVEAVERADGDEYGYWSRILRRAHGQGQLGAGRVAEDGDGLTGLSLVREDDALVMVDPRAEGRRVGAALRAWAEGEAMRRGHRQHRQMVMEGTRAARALAAAGYAPRRVVLRMAVDLDRPPQPPSWPEGLRVGSLRGEDAEEAQALDETAFADEPDFQPADDWPGEFLNEEVELALSPAVRDGEGKLVAIALSERWPSALGYVALVAVRPDLWGRGIGSALLRDVLSRFHAAGLRRGALGVAEDNERALRLYRGLGMQPVYRVIAYERPAG